MLSLLFEHSRVIGGRYKLVKPKLLEITQKLSQKIQGNDQTDDNYIEETILENEEVFTYTTRTNNKTLNPTAFRPPSHRGTPESTFRPSPKSSPEAISVNNGNINPLTGTPLTWEDPKNLTRAQEEQISQDMKTHQPQKTGNRELGTLIQLTPQMIS